MAAYEHLVISGWQKVSMIDYPGRPSTLVFFGGCNLRCPFCHNPDIVRHNTPQVIDPETVLQYCHSRRHVLDGIVLSGGEPCLYRLDDFVAEVRSMGYRVKLDTNGMLPDVSERLAPDYCALDVKTAPQRYAGSLGCKEIDVGPKLQRSIDMVRRMGARGEVRITAAPGIVDAEAIAQIAGLCAGVHTVYLQRMQYHDGHILDPVFFEGREPFTEEHLARFRAHIAPHVTQCLIR
jgi:pyruvate formate lyase activating enzyme